MAKRTVTRRIKVAIYTKEGFPKLYVPYAKTGLELDHELYQQGYSLGIITERPFTVSEDAFIQCALSEEKADADVFVSREHLF